MKHFIFFVLLASLFIIGCGEQATPGTASQTTQLAPSMPAGEIATPVAASATITPVTPPTTEPVAATAN